MGNAHATYLSRTSFSLVYVALWGLEYGLPSVDVLETVVEISPSVSGLEEVDISVEIALIQVEIVQSVTGVYVEDAVVVVGCTGAENKGESGEDDWGLCSHVRLIV